MRTKSVKEEYFNWLVEKIITEDHEYMSNYISLFNHLFEANYYWIIPHDSNRYSDGLMLRERFGKETGINIRSITNALDFPCTVLEVLWALAVRCEIEIMSNPDLGDRTCQWFWVMITNLGLGSMDDYNYDPDTIDYILDRWLEGDIEKNGGGSPFVISNPDRNMRNAELWYQANWYLCEITEGENNEFI